MLDRKDKRLQGYRTNVGFSIGIIAIPLLLFAYYAFTWQNAYNFKAAIDSCLQPFCDFATFYYPMGETIFQTSLPLKGFVYSPFTAILFSVFPLFGLDTSLILWGLLQALVILLYLLLFRRLIPTGQRIHLLFIFLALSSFPLLHIITWGQVGFIITVSILGALFCYEQGHRVLAAALLAFGMSFKFFPIIFVMPFVFRRDVRFLLLTAAACATFLFVIPCLLLGTDNTLSFYSGLLDEYRNFDWVITNYNSQHFPHVFLRYAEVLEVNAGVQLPLLRGISYGIAAVNMGLVYLIQRAQLPHANLWSFHILFLTIPFVLVTSWPVDLVYVSFGQGLLAWHLREGKDPPEKTSRRNTALVLLFTSIIVSNIFFFNIIGDHIRYGYIGFIFWSNLFLLASTYVELLPIALMSHRKGKCRVHIARESLWRIRVQKENL